MSANEPAPTAPFTDEDRSRVDELVEMADRIASVGGFPREQVDSLTRALAYITHLEGALMAAAWPIHAMGDDHPDMPGWAREPIKWLHDLQARADHLEGALEAADEAALDLAAQLEREADCETPPSNEWWNGQMEALLREAAEALRRREDGARAEAAFHVAKHETRQQAKERTEVRRDQRTVSIEQVEAAGYAMPLRFRGESIYDADDRRVDLRAVLEEHGG